MSATVHQIRPEVDRCLSDIKMFQDLLRECSAEMNEDEAVLEDSKRRYFEIQNHLRVALHKLHIALGLE